uniref:Uncharacterized protein n=1 Tax=Arundo donax TaxID=35708 RepID=A0A0A8YRM0_ARUDO
MLHLFYFLGYFYICDVLVKTWVPPFRTRSVKLTAAKASCCFTFATS